MNGKRLVVGDVVDERTWIWNDVDGAGNSYRPGFGCRDRRSGERGALECGLEVVTLGGSGGGVE